MINPNQVFVADAKPYLALTELRSAYVFGAALPLGEALLNQLLASRCYSKVYVSTTAPLPATVAHLHGVVRGDPNIQPFVVQDLATAIDCFFIVSDNDPDTPAASGARYGFAARSTVYAPLLAKDAPTILSQVAIATHNLPHAHLRWLIAAPDVTTTVIGSWVSSYSAYLPCMVYGLGTGERGAGSQTAYQFKPEGNTVLDRLGVWVLNTVSNVAHSMMNPQGAARLTAVKTAQRLVARFEGLSATAGLSTLTASDLA